MVTADRLLAAEEYAQLEDDGRPTELVRGRIVRLHVPIFFHGKYCSRIDRIVGGEAVRRRPARPGIAGRRRVDFSRTAQRTANSRQAMISVTSFHRMVVD